MFSLLRRRRRENILRLIDSKKIHNQWFLHRRLVKMKQPDPPKKTKLLKISTSRIGIWNLKKQGRNTKKQNLTKQNIDGISMIPTGMVKIDNIGAKNCKTLTIRSRN